MTDFSFDQYQEEMKPFADLISGIVHIVGYEDKKEEKEKSEGVDRSDISLSINYAP